MKVIRLKSVKNIACVRQLQKMSNCLKVKINLDRSHLKLDFNQV